MCKQMRQWGAALVAAAVIFGPAAGQEETYRMQERFPIGARYHVKTRVELEGSLSVPAAKGRPAKSVKVQGESAIDYDERIVALDAHGAVSKSLRICQRLDFRRTLAGQPQGVSLRPVVRRLVVLRRGTAEVPFSPDGPLTWGEIDAVRTDVFAPALAGLLPMQSVRVGEKWTAATASVRELTDLDKIDQGGLECHLERIVTQDGKRRAKVAFHGTVRGVGEDGPVRHQLRGSYSFDLTDSFLLEVTLTGTTVLLDGAGKEVGRIEGRFVMSRDRKTRSDLLSDAAVRGVKLEPDAENTLLLYDNPDLGLRFLHARRWRVAQVMGPQVALAASDGSGVLITVDPLARVPTTTAFLAESRGWLEKQKAKLLRIYSARQVRTAPLLEAFALEAEMNGQRFWMDYYISRQDKGGATIAARQMLGDLANLRREVDRIARSVTITRKLPAK